MSGINWSKLQAHLHGRAMSGLQVESWEAWTQWKQHKAYGQIDVVWAPRGWHVVPMYGVSVAVNDQRYDPDEMKAAVEFEIQKTLSQGAFWLDDKGNDIESSDKRPRLAIVSRRVTEPGEP